MFCPLCGTQCDRGRFCTHCGTRLPDPTRIPPVKEPFVKVVNGVSVDLNLIRRAYNGRWGAYAHLVTTCNISWKQAKAVMDPVYEAHMGERISYWSSLSASATLDRQRRVRRKLDRWIRCPKCRSTNVTVQEIGIQFIDEYDGYLQPERFGPYKRECVCLSCGRTWTPKK